MKRSAGQGTPIDEPRLGMNCIKSATSVLVCSTRGCYLPVTVKRIPKKTGSVTYACEKHGVRQRGMMEFMEILGTPAKLVWRKIIQRNV